MQQPQWLSIVNLRLAAVKTLTKCLSQMVTICDDLMGSMSAPA